MPHEAEQSRLTRSASRVRDGEQRADLTRRTVQRVRVVAFAFGSTRDAARHAPAQCLRYATGGQAPLDVGRRGQARCSHAALTRQQDARLGAHPFALTSAERWIAHHDDRDATAGSPLIDDDRVITDLASRFLQRAAQG